MPTIPLGEGSGLPEGLRIYAIGDIHGRLDLLRALYARIAAEIADAPPARTIEVFLGDFIDRGPQSAGVVEWLASDTSAADRRICLMGNHEDMLLEVLHRADAMPHWLDNGAMATLLSYDVLPTGYSSSRDFERARDAFLAALPDHHREFLQGLPRYFDLESYLFVHAGIRPEVPVQWQNPEDLVWIRDPFLSFSGDHGRIVVHGHTPVEFPDIRRNRINIDTGAVFSGRLTCLVLEGDGMRLLHADSSDAAG